ncbi:hypothetical protein A2634_00480 [Candidatus Amesbacteria bacterium RIFCSPHIGHO2_01_FULL_48_32]|uniref:HTH cro/C1-type domain-containing protein n=1 Tax=Candidatus Amesbacteria bacterium RIFCSPLOWO2_01_FULL_48_25 TaxID=1797259 RepID=A0A1F4ZAJ8_9BACT|nr:MAG: hypothetical protein A2634_00480 [Candidatus Amesbacteria bacterium RIFCSPHIGHO2_01_FULL_48_32]OGD03283.1 MAG: hypothetical protein A2989_00430 [Candidatus Amesbacteria bacterium RIFCSPLOWO2_01_FULL_48_25]HJZ05231.1 helix-turn-helix domain-containing protein [Patescibacteria group bacterium]
MKTAGQILSATRVSKKLELEDVARVTKIRPHFIKSIESDDYRALPSGAVARGFIRNYSEYLNLNPDHLLAVFRRDFVENPQGQIVPRGMAEPVSRPDFWTPKTTITAIVCLIFAFFGVYLIYQYRLLTGPPPLTISQPQPGATTGEATVEITGVTDPEATISVNRQLVALEKGGQFYLRLPLEPGLNTIVVTSTAKSGKSTSITRTISRVQ